MPRTRFSSQHARRFYDRFGARQDRQGFYEDVALEALIAHGDFSSARAVLELGCGTGRFAAGLLAERLPAGARYVGIDISETMVQLARERLAPRAIQSDVYLADGTFDFAAFGGPFDRFVATYVFDLLSPESIGKSLAAARQVLRDGGLLCAAGLTNGTGWPSSMTSRLWTWVHRVNPSLVGGCRPLVLAEFLPATQWRIRHREVVVSATVPSEVLVAEAVLPAAHINPRYTKSRNRASPSPAA